ncbi:MAG: hypothetical protein QME64_11495 [bacterium]|nr:hypothetical protein [bacterium]
MLSISWLNFGPVFPEYYTLWSQILVIVGFIAMLIGVLDPLEGSFIILPGSGLVALGAFLGKSRYRILLNWAFILIAVGVGAMIVISMFGGIGGNTGRSLWWGLVILPYPIGWFMGIIGIVLRLIESCKNRKQ